MNEKKVTNTEPITYQLGQKSVWMVSLQVNCNTKSNNGFVVTIPTTLEKVKAFFFL